VELAEMVLEYLPFRHLVSCMRVSKGWRDYLSKLPKLWMHLDLKGARKPVPRSFINSAFRYSEMRMTRVTLHRFEHMDVIKNLAKAAKHLTEVEIISLPHAMSASLVEVAKSSSKLKKFTIHADITADAVERILQARPTLEHVAFHGVLPLKHPMKWTETFVHLHTFSLTCIEKTSAQQLEIAKLLSLTPSLRSLSLCNVNAFHVSDRGWPLDASQLPSLTTLILKRVTFEQYIALPDTLQCLVLDNDGGTLGRFSNSLSWAYAKLADLTHLSLSGFSVSPEKFDMLLDLHIEDRALKPLIGGKPLQHLSLRCLLDPEVTLINGPKAVLCKSQRILTPHLESLDLGTMPCTDDDVEHLLTYETGLTTIDLSNTNITGASIKMLVDKLSSLKQITADNCTKITSRDAIDYAERKGVAVSYQMGEQKGGRRIRYG
jgi:F-box/TPR repeat protein Pof3